MVLPFVFVALASRCSVAPLGDRIARGVAAVAPKPPPATEPPVIIVATPSSLDAGTSGDDGDELAGRLPVIPPEHHEVRRRAEVAVRDAGAGASADGGTDGGVAAPIAKAFFVPVGAVTRALERRDVGAQNAVLADGTPVGARLVGVSKYGTGLHDGDIVVSVNGTRTPNVNAMVSAAMGAVSGGATRIGGRVLRGDATYGVILEVPPR